MKKFTYGCDMGSMKIQFKDAGACFFDNQYGDGEFKVFICKKGEEPAAEFQGHFTVFKEGVAYLMASDCSDDIKADGLFEFPVGRWFVYLDEKKTIFYILKCDEDLNS